jgi:Asp-tRNA(Asn)/Glu-tRNA(Gln) amidotransferase A subunit family amidase
MPYERRALRAPRLAGARLRLVCAAAEAPVIGPLLRRSMVARLGIGPFRRVDLGTITPQGRPLPPDRGQESGADDARVLVEEALSADASPSRAASLDDYAEAYREGRSSPSEVAERVIELVCADATQDPPLLPLLAQHQDDVRRQAESSSARWRAGAPLSPFDGVPVVIKDELHVTGYPTTLGTTFLGQGPAEEEDATAVARLRALGALLVGKANMHELGLGVTGLNPHHGSARNPYDPARATGGSSSGSAVSVASGLAPAAIGCDGGGSIRIPASLCGAFGLKATFGRVSEVGVPPLCWSVAHAGPLAGTARDLAATYAAVAGRDPGDRASLRQPPPDLEGYVRGDLEGVRIGLASSRSAEPPWTSWSTWEPACTRSRCLNRT